MDGDYISDGMVHYLKVVVRGSGGFYQTSDSCQLLTLFYMKKEHERK